MRAVVGLVLILAAAGAAFIVFPLSLSSAGFLVIGDSEPTIRWYSNMLNQPWPQATLRSLCLALVVSSLATIAAIPVAFARGREGVTLGWRAFDIAVQSTLLLPPISLAVAYFRLFGEGQIWALALGHLVLCLAFPYLALSAGSRRFDWSTIEAAELLGSSIFTTVVRIWLPALKPFLFLGAFLAFLYSWDETVFTVFLTTPQQAYLPKVIWETMQRDRDLTAAAINCLTGVIFASISISFYKASQP